MTYPGMKQHQKELLLEYGPRLKDVDESFVKELYYPILDQVYDIMEDKVAPNVKKWDEEGAKLVNGRVQFPDGVEDVYKALISDKNGLRLYEAFLPEEHDGVGLPPLVLGPIVETMAAYDLSFNVTATLAITLIEAISLYPTEHLTGKYFPMLQEGAAGYVGFTEPDAGSNLKNLKATSTLDGDDYIVKGTKIWISNAGYADLGLILARNIVNGEDQGHNAFIVESNMPNADGNGGPGVVCSRLEEKIGIHASSTGVLEYNVRVPKENIIGEVGKGYRRVLERLMGMRMGVAFQSSGIADRAYQLAKAYSEERVQFNKPIASFPGVANKITGMEKELIKMRRLGFEASYVLSRNQQKLPINPKYLTVDADGQAMLDSFPLYATAVVAFAVSRAKMYNSEVGWMVTDDALQIFGGNGVAKEYEVERLIRDFRVLRIYEGTSEIQEGILDRTKAAAKAKNIDALMALAEQTGRPEPEFKPLDYGEIFFTRFPKSKDAFVDENSDDFFLWKN
ncbi:MAG: acyl-CoA dehydrogenase family protein [Candidatus Hodarchaeales archaeon]|jgi:alkylation response protein AidB-like acyl-CoA dehydrogenase